MFYQQGIKRSLNRSLGQAPGLSGCKMRLLVYIPLVSELTCFLRFVIYNAISLAGENGNQLLTYLTYFLSILKENGMVLRLHWLIINKEM